MTGVAVPARSGALRAEPQASQAKPPAANAGRFMLKRWHVSVRCYGSGIYEAPTRGRALADAWSCDAFYGVSFKDFLRVASCWRAETTPDFGAPITVCGKPAFFVSSNRAYVRFVRPDCKVISSAHPYDVEPVEFRPAQYRPSPVNTVPAQADTHPEGGDILAPFMGSAVSEGDASEPHRNTGDNT